MPPGRPKTDPLLRFNQKWIFSEEYEYESEPCWEWTAGKRLNGYGRFWVDGKNVSAHRWSYEYFIGPIPEGLQIDHLCRNRECCNPKHLEAVTCQENLLRGNTFAARNSQKTHCKNGHPFDGRNTGTSVRGHRYCRACQREYWNRRGRWLRKNPGLVGWVVTR